MPKLTLSDAKHEGAKDAERRYDAWRDEGFDPDKQPYEASPSEYSESEAEYWDGYRDQIDIEVLAELSNCETLRERMVDLFNEWARTRGGDHWRELGPHEDMVMMLSRSFVYGLCMHESQTRSI